jgi:hypothetical protein
MVNSGQVHLTSSWGLGGMLKMRPSCSYKSVASSAQFRSCAGFGFQYEVTKSAKVLLHLDFMQ